MPRVFSPAMEKSFFPGCRAVRVSSPDRRGPSRASISWRKIMKIRVFLTLTCAAACTLAGQTQPPAKQTESPATKEIREEFYAVTNNIRHAADKMPETNYGFKPASGMRTFGEAVAHVADLHSKTCRTC